MINKFNKLDVFSIVLGSIIGWGAFMLPGTKFLKEAGVVNTAIGLFLGALAIIIIEKNYTVMLEECPDNGGEFVYAYKNLGEGHGFMVGWFLTLAYLSIVPLNATAFPLVVKKIFKDLLEFGYLYNVAGYEVYLGEVLLSSLVIIIFAYINIKGVKSISRIQNIIVIVLVISVTFIFGLMIYKVDTDIIKTAYINNYKFDFKQIFMIFSIAPWAFIGFDSIAQLSGDLNMSPKKASLTAVIALLFGALLYNMLNIITAMVFPVEDLVNLEWATGIAVYEKLGLIPFIILVVSLTAAVWSGINGFMICTSKLIASIAEYGVIPNIFSKINISGSNVNAIIFISIVSLIAPWFGRSALSWIVDMSSLGAAIAYFYVSYIAIRKSKNIKNKIYGILGTLISLIFICLLLIPGSPAVLGMEPMIALLIWIIIGFTYYKVNRSKFKSASIN